MVTSWKKWVLLPLLLLGSFSFSLTCHATISSGDEALAPWVLLPGPNEVLLKGRILDSGTGQAIPARIYIKNKEGQSFFARSTSPQGRAIVYQKQHSHISGEQHTVLSAHPFVALLPVGLYTITVERGKEYHPLVVQLGLDGKKDSSEFDFKVERWIDMARQGWYSGETHVHRLPSELPLLQLAEDLNVAFPLTYWVTKGETPPTQGDKNMSPVESADPVQIDPKHIYFPRNTEYEIFSMHDKKHTLGAFFILNHRSVFQQGVPPVGPVAALAHSEKALIEMDKHAWEWSMMLVPVMDVDLYELANNHLWRTEFGFRNWGIKAPAYMKLEEGGTEWAWMDYGFQNYYALLNCGFRLRPTAGTASGVHPVPLGFGRVYVFLKDQFDGNAWINGLNAGRSFVTTGPMLFARANGALPGETFKTSESNQSVRVQAEFKSMYPLRRLQIISNGEVIFDQKPANDIQKNHYVSKLSEKLQFKESGWVVVRGFEALPDGRLRFAHSAPWHVQISGKPLRPRKAEVQFLIQRVTDEIARNQGVLSEASLEEYRKALQIYEDIAKHAR